MDTEVKVIIALGASLFMVGLGLLIWGGIIRGSYLHGFIGSVASLIGLALLTKKV